MNGALWNLEDRTPEVHESVYVAPGAQIIGGVRLGARSSVWFNTVLRGDTEWITIGAETNIQDLSLGHADPGTPLTLGDRVTVGHRCILHGCVVEDDCLIGMGAIVMNGARIGLGSIIGAGAVVLEQTVIPPYSLVVGSPAQVRKTYDDSVLMRNRLVAQVYVNRSGDYLKALKNV
ncbi:MAG: gamma carbonic anhydrase family protein [bacterium]|jgi:carbonic anhydrase/acetyltransferase-like protein (isoleucine patch superfamily)